MPTGGKSYSKPPPGAPKGKASTNPYLGQAAKPPTAAQKKASSAAYGQMIKTMPKRSAQSRKTPR